MSHYKILFTGPVGAGKTTAIRSLADELPVSTDERASDDTRYRKANTTVAMDYGVMRLADGEQLHLYGTPGQERFDFMWEILQVGALGLVVLVDNAMEDPIGDARFFLDTYRDFIDRTKVAIGVTRVDLRPTPTIEDYLRGLADLGLHQVRLLTNNPAKVDGLRAHGIEVTRREGLAVGQTPYNAAYLQAKRDLMGHRLEVEDPVARQTVGEHTDEQEETA